MTKTSTATNKDSKSKTSVQLAFIVLATVQGTLIFTIALIMIPLPVIADEFALSSSQILLLQVAYGLPFNGLLLLGGRLTDRYGPRRMFTIGLTIFAIASLAAPTTSSFDVLIAMLFLEGIGGAIVAPAALGVVRLLYPDMAGFGRAMAIWGGVSVMGAVLGFISSGMIASVVSWRWMFAVPVAVSLLGLVTTPSLLPATPLADRTQRPGLDPLGALLATSGIILSSYALIVSQDTIWLSVEVLGLLAMGILLLIAFLVVERKVHDPLLPPTFLRNPVRLIGLAGMLLAAAGATLIQFVLLLYLQQMRGWTSLETATSFIPFAVALIGTSFLTASVVGRFGAKTVTVAGFLIGGAGLALIVFISQDTEYLEILLPAQVLLAIGMALVFARAAVLSTVNVPERQMGLAGGVMNTAMELGPTVGFTILMAVAATGADSVDGYARAFATAAAAYVFAALVALTVTSKPLAFRI